MRTPWSDIREAETTSHHFEAETASHLGEAETTSHHFEAETASHLDEAETRPSQKPSIAPEWRRHRGTARGLAPGYRGATYKNTGGLPPFRDSLETTSHHFEPETASHLGEAETTSHHLEAETASHLDEAETTSHPSRFMQSGGEHVRVRTPGTSTSP